MRHLLVALVFLSLASQPALGADAPAAPTFSQEQLDQMLAPIALYPDSLLAQVLMAATYPLEVVEAARWSSANPNAKGDDALKAVQDQTWDPSVKSLVAFPTVLTMLNDKLDWTQQLGDAFLAQQEAVMSTVQSLRKRAQQAGQLQSTEQQKVTTQAQTIVIQPAQPQVIYVPAYNPTVVYGAWPYPAYPPVYFPPPPGYAFGTAVAAGIGFGIGIAVTDAIFGGFDWHHSQVNINVNRYNNINVHNINRTNIYNVNRNQVTNVWQHDATHRRGVAYRDPGTQRRYSNTAGTRAAANVDARRDYRGFDTTHDTSATRRNVGATETGLKAPQDRSRSPSANPTRSSAFTAAPSENIERSAAARGRASTTDMHFEPHNGGGSFSRRSARGRR